MSDMESGAAPQPDRGTGTAVLEREPETLASPVVPPPTQPPGTGTASSEWRDMPRGARNGGLIAGIVLIVLGALVLFGRYAPWGYIWRLWPLIIVVSGIVEAIRPRGEAPIKRIASGLGTVVTGAILLCNTFDVIPWSVWLTMLSLWPLLIVALGIELVGKGLKSDAVRALSNVLLTLGLLYGAFVLGPGWTGGMFSVLPVSGQLESYQLDVPHNSNVSVARADIKAGALRLNVGAGDKLVAIDGRTQDNYRPGIDTNIGSTASSVAEITVKDPDEGAFLLPGAERLMNVALDRSVSWEEVRLDIGAADARVDLTELDVRKVAVNVGASSVRLTVGSKSRSVEVDVNGGATSVVVRVPGNAGVSVVSDSGLSGVSVPSDFQHVSGIAVLGEGRWTKQGSGGPDIVLTLKSGVSSLEIETY